MLAKLYSFGLDGLKGFCVEVEADINNGMPSYETVGLPDTAIKESKERIRSAVKNCRFQFPTSRITVNLAPADIKKVGPMYDLPIAVCILAASEQLDFRRVKNCCILGELSLDGRVRRLNGILPILIAAKSLGFERFMIPAENAREAEFIEGIKIYGIENLRQAVEFLSGEIELQPLKHSAPEDVIAAAPSIGDFKFVKGQYRAKRAMEIAAAGGHNIILIGPPGAGKTMLAKAMPGILPDLTAAEAMETTMIHSVSGKLDANVGIVNTRPFRSPHHTATMISLTGGGNNARPGEISLAHNGVLFLDELPEYNKHVLETLRQPLEDGEISVTRNARSVVYPANFMLVASMNPCPCGYYGSEKEPCTCSASMIQKYLSKLSGPLLDRIDLQVEVDCVDYEDLKSAAAAESSADIKDRVKVARAIQTKRFDGSNTHSNAKMTSEQVKAVCALSSEADNLLHTAFDALKMSARGYNRVLKVARTIADLAGSESIGVPHIAEAVRFRSLDRKYIK